MPHTCPYPLCPYQGLQGDCKDTIISYTGQYGTDAYYLDSLHIVHPTSTYEQLEQALTSIHTPNKPKAMDDYYYIVICIVAIIAVGAILIAFSDDLKD